MNLNFTVNDFVSDQALEFAEAMSETKTLDDLIRRIHLVVNNLGIDCFTFYEFSAPDPLITGTFPSEWIDHYQRQHYNLADPMFILLRRGVRPVLWKELEPYAARNAASKKILGEASEFRLLDGYSVPISDPSGMRCLLSFSTIQLDSHPKLLLALQLISVFAHAKYEEIVATAQDGLGPLSDREIECLKWAAAGKTDWEIGQIIEVKTTTVRTHLEHARQKLNAANKVEAVAKAIRRKILTP
jgi:LuxR family transcriptional regulator, quorum-sensing system regulator BjaR1